MEAKVGKFFLRSKVSIIATIKVSDLSWKSMKSGISTIFILIFTFTNNLCVASPIDSPGVHAKAGAGAGQTISRGPTSLFYNPANLIYSKFIEPYLDVGFTTVNYQFLSIDEEFEVAGFEQSGPPITFSLGIRPFPSLSLGFVYHAPAEAGFTALGVPLNLDGTLKPYDIALQKKVTVMGAGAAFRFLHELTVGVGVLMTTDTQSIAIGEPEAEVATVDEIFKASYMQIVAGLRSELFSRAVVVGLSYRTGTMIKYQGLSFLASRGGEEDADFEGIGYAPGAIGFGLETRFANFGVFVDVVLEQWTAGRLIARRGFPDEPLATDYIDTMNLAGGLKWWFLPKHMFQVGGGIYPANIGDGITSEAASAALHNSKDQANDQAKDGAISLLQDDEIEDDGSIAGAQFGDLNAIAKTVVSLGYRAKISGHGYFHTGFQMISGSRVIPEDAEGAGQYTLSAMVFGLGVAFGF